MTEGRKSIPRAEGVTATERYLGKLATQSFLSLWSYPSIYRDQGDGDGKEICDLLVVFGDHVIIFSDKDVAYPDTGDADLDWQRWYRRAVAKSAAQVWGAERWLRSHPDRVFLDRKCAVPFPYPLPSTDEARFHRVVVAHDTSGRRRRLTGGSGSLIILPDIAGEEHVRPSADGGQPLAVGRIATDKGFVHILDEVSMEAVLRTLDTTSDFVAYLEKKERLIQSGRLYAALGEEELLAYYLKNVDDQDVHDFVLPKDDSRLVLEEGHFANFIRSPEYAAKAEADRISHLWDAIIEDFAAHAAGGTLYHMSDESFHNQERILRTLAREPRVRRRMLSRGILQKLQDTPQDSLGIRTLGPSYPGDPWYVFACVPQEWGGSREEYRKGRVALLQSYAKVLKLENPQIETIVGIATESGLENGGRSHDLVLADCTQWVDEDYEEARRIQEDTDFLKKASLRATTEEEYPLERYFPTGRKVGRNDRCPCGSGLKYKKCCLKRRN